MFDLNKLGQYYGCWWPGSLHLQVIIIWYMYCPGSLHGPPWYWLSKLGSPLSSTRKKVNYLYHSNVEERYKTRTGTPAFWGYPLPPCDYPYYCPVHIGSQTHPDSKVHGANMGPTWVLSAPDGPHVDPINLAIRVYCWPVRIGSQVQTRQSQSYKFKEFTNT